MNNLARVCQYCQRPFILKTGKAFKRTRCYRDECQEQHLMVLREIARVRKPWKTQPRPCKHCGTVFMPKRYGHKSLYCPKTRCQAEKIRVLRKWQRGYRDGHIRPKKGKVDIKPQPVNGKRFCGWCHKEIKKKDGNYFFHKEVCHEAAIGEELILAVSTEATYG